MITLGTPITVGGSGATVSGNTVTIVAGGAFCILGTLADGMIEVNTTGEVQMSLQGMSLTHSVGPAINVISAPMLSLVLADGTTNTLIDGASYTGYTAKGTVFSNDPLTISGGGSLAVTSRYKHAIASDDNIVIEGGNLTVVAVTDGIHANDDITVNNGTIRVTQVGSDGFESEGTFQINGGAMTLTVADDGVIGTGTVTINGGTINVTSGTEGIESKNNLVVNGGSISVVVSDDGLNATNDIAIGGGDLYINATGDAVDSNGTMHFTGGVIVALGGAMPEGGLDCDNCLIALDGGIVVGSGGRNSTPSGASGQRVLIVNTRPVGTIMHIVRDDGVGVFTFAVTKAYQSMIVTSPYLLANRTYTVYTGGSVSGGTNFHGLYTGATYTGGTVWTTFNTNAVVTRVGG